MTNETASEARVTPDAIERLDLDVEWEPGHVGAYLVEGDEPVLVDAGVPGDDGEADVARALDDHGYGFADIDHVLITHPHLDHVGAVPAVLDATEPTVYAPEGTRSYYDLEAREDEAERYARLVGFEGPMLDQALERWRDGLERNRSALPPDQIDRFVAGGDEVTVGPLAIEAVHTPGHQIHHLCFLADAGDRVMFSGDALLASFRATIYQVGFGEGMFAAVEDYYASYDRLRDHSPDRIYPGHGPVFEDYEAAVAQGEESLDDLVADVADVLDETAGATALDVTMTRFDDADRIESALFDTVGALGYLDAVDRASSTVEDGARVFRST